MHWKPPTTSWLHWATLSLLVTLSLSSSQIQMDPDGGYTGIVIKINKDVPEDLCPQILSNLKVSMSDKFSQKYSRYWHLPNKKAIFRDKWMSRHARMLIDKLRRQMNWVLIR